MAYTDLKPYFNPNAIADWLNAEIDTANYAPPLGSASLAPTLTKGANTLNLNFTPDMLGSYGYVRVRVALLSGGYSAWSNVSLNGIDCTTPCPSPVFSLHPSNQSVMIGGTLTLSVVVSPSTNGQWYKDGSPISGATSTTYTKTNFQVADIGSYHYMATNACNTNAPASASSNVATVQQGTVTTYWNAAQSQSFTRNNCPVGQVGSSVTYTVPANTYSSTISQADADNQALADIAANGQAYANVNGTCSTAYYNTVQSQSFTRNNCPVGQVGSSVTYTVPANTYSSTISQADADNQALADIAANGQAYANVNGTCSSITCAAPTNVTASASGLTAIAVSWTAASPAPSNGYVVRLYALGGSLLTTYTTTNTTFNISPLSANTYYVEVLSDCGGVFSSPVASGNVVVAGCTAVSACGLSAVDNGNSITLTAVVEPVSPTTPLAYHWFKGGIEIFSTSLTPTINTSTTSIMLDDASNVDDGGYSLQIVDACGNTVSSTNISGGVGTYGHTYTCVPLTSVDINVDNSTPPQGSTVTFTVTHLPSNASTPVTYELIKDSVVIATNTTGVFTITSWDDSINAGEYGATASNIGVCSSGNMVGTGSNTIMVTNCVEVISVALGVTDQSPDVGDTVVFTATTTPLGATNVTIDFVQNGTVIFTENNVSDGESTFTIPSYVLGYDGDWWVDAQAYIEGSSTPCGLGVQSPTITMTGNSCTPITGVVLSVDTTNAPAGYDFAFSGVISPSSASTPKTWELKKDGVVVGSASFTGGTVSTNYTENVAGVYDFTMEATNCGGTVVSNTVQVTVT